MLAHKVRVKLFHYHNQPTICHLLFHSHTLTRTHYSFVHDPHEVSTGMCQGSTSEQFVQCHGTHHHVSGKILEIKSVCISVSAVLLCTFHSSTEMPQFLDLKGLFSVNLQERNAEGFIGGVNFHGSYSQKT